MNLKNKYIVFCVFLYQIWCVAAFVKVAYAFFISQDIILSKIAWPVETGTFHQSNFRASSVDCFSVLGHVIRRYAIISFLNVFPPSLVLIVLLEVALWRFNKWRDQVTYRNGISFYSNMHSNQVIVIVVFVNVVI